MTELYDGRQYHEDSHPLQFVCPVCNSHITTEVICSVCGEGMCSQTQFTFTRRRRVPLFLVGEHHCNHRLNDAERAKIISSGSR